MSKIQVLNAWRRALLVACSDVCNSSREMKVDVEWFTRKIAESRFGSIRQLAPHVIRFNGKPMDQPMLSRVLSGDRELTAHEAVQLAILLEVPLVEVMERYGLRVPQKIR